MLIFLGDSITEWWDKDIYERDYSRYKNINLGVAGLTTHGLMDIVNSESFRNYQPKLIVLMIGINNVYRGINSEFIIQDIKHIIEKILSIHPGVKILLRGVLPSGKYKTDRIRVSVEEINNTISTYQNNTNVFYIDNGSFFLNSDESLRENLMPDNLHLSKQGYEALSYGLTHVIHNLID
jgi:lysophospholipase L1-like esterase